MTRYAGHVGLRPVQRADVPAICAWRAAARPYLRTAYVLTEDQQARFVESVINDREAHSRYWIVELSGHGERHAVGVAALTGIEWENGLAEVSIILDPAHQRQGIGHAVFKRLRHEAFSELRLQLVVAEVYAHNPALIFWQAEASCYRIEAGEGMAEVSRLPRRKFSGAAFHDVFCFNFLGSAW